MIWHPLLLVVLLMDGSTLLLVLAAAANAMQIVLGWSPGSATSGQLQRERKAEAASLQVRYAIAIYFFSTLILIFGIADILPQVVPGAMCGTGVLQATHGQGYRALLLRFIALGAMGCWHLLDRFNCRQPDGPLTVPAARTVLLIMPLVSLAVIATGRAILNLDIQQPVTCCAAVYDQVRSARQIAGTTTIPDRYWMWGFLLVSGVQLLGAIGMWRIPGPRLGRSVLQMGVACCWTVLAVIALVRIFAAYHYQVLNHHCPWCLFLPVHHGVGYPLFTALAVATLEGFAAVLTALVDRHHPQLREFTASRSRRAGRNMFLATGIFLLLTVLPALLWKMRFGVWMR